MYKFVHQNLDPVLDTFNELVDTPEGKVALKKLHEDKLERAYEESLEAEKER